MPVLYEAVEADEPQSAQHSPTSGSISEKQKKHVSHFEPLEMGYTDADIEARDGGGIRAADHLVLEEDDCDLPSSASARHRALFFHICGVRFSLPNVVSMRFSSSFLL